MSWFKGDDKLRHNRKLRACSVNARWLYMCGLSYSADLETDGYIPVKDLPLVSTDVPAIRQRAAELVERGLWHTRAEFDACPRCSEKHRSPAEGEYLIHKYLHRNRSHSQLEEERGAAARRKAKHDAKKNGVSTEGTNGVTDEGSNTVPDDGQNGVTNAPPDLTSPGLSEDSSTSKPSEFDYSEALSDDQQYLLGRLIERAPTWAVEPTAIGFLRAQHGNTALTEALQRISLLDDDGLRAIESPMAYLTTTVVDCVPVKEAS